MTPKSSSTVSNSASSNTKNTSFNQKEDSPQKTITNPTPAIHKTANGLSLSCSSESINSSKNQLEAKRKEKHAKVFKRKIVWFNVITMSMLHLAALYGIWLVLIEAKWQTVYAQYVVGMASAMGILAGAHRLWSHKSYKANWQLRTLLAIFETMALQNDIYEWCRDHRVHHKFSETDADPHNSNRGFFFAHMGWLLCKKHPDVIEKGSKVDMSDLWSDPIVRFQRRFYIPLVILIWAAIPTLIPYYCWGESLWNAFFLCVTLRYCYVLHSAWLVNSAAHLWGSRPYDRDLQPRENSSVQYLTLGEGYHNYHHAFPWDYSASEHGWTANFNVATMFIDFFAWIGWAYDLKKVPTKLVKQRKQRCGEDESEYKPWIRAKIIRTVLGWVMITFPIWSVFLGRWLLRVIFEYFQIDNLIYAN